MGMADKGTLLEVLVDCGLTPRKLHAGSADFEDPVPIALVLRSKAKRVAVRAAPGEAEEGRFPAQEAMDAWVSSWATDSQAQPPDADVTGIGGR